MKQHLLFLILTILLLATAPGASVSALELDGDFVQGGLVIGKTEPGASVNLGDRTLPVAPDGTFIMAFSREHPAQANLTVQFPDGTTKARTFAIQKRDWDIQRIDGLPSNKVTPSEEELTRIRTERQQIREARAETLQDLIARQQFIWPVTGRISGIFGSQRVLNGEPRSPHKGVDIAAPTGTPIVAPAPGVVRLTHDDMFYSGGTVILDHGLGLNSIYIHLHEISVKPGQRLERGEVLGTVGSTGRSTGPHLHWGVSHSGVAIDPEMIVPAMTTIN